MLAVIAWISTSGVAPGVLSLSGVTLIEWTPEIALPDGIFIDICGCSDPAVLIGSLPTLPLLIDAIDAPPMLHLPSRATVVTDEVWRSVVVSAWVAGLGSWSETRVLLRHDVWTPVAVLAGHLEMLSEGMYGPVNPRLDSATRAMSRAVGQLESKLGRVGENLFGDPHGGTGKEQE